MRSMRLSRAMTKFKEIPGCPGYSVTSDGRVWSNTSKRFLAPNKVGRGYLRVYFYGNSEKRYEYIHRLVAEAFIPNPHNYPTVNHKDENKTNNNADNLEWCSYSYNNRYNNGTEKRKEKNGRPILKLNPDGSLAERFRSVSEASAASGISRQSLRRRINFSVLPQNYGQFIWKYERR